MRRTIVMMICVLVVAAYATRADESVERKALSGLQDYVGDWRGVGQLQRGSTKGSWIESCGWAWKFESGEATLVVQNKDGKYFESGQLAADRAGGFLLTASINDKKPLQYAGRLDDRGVLVLTASDPPAGLPARISIRQVANGKRMIVLYERQIGSDRYTRMSEVGYTREGSNFGKGTNYIECVVTGGVGTIPVTHQGKTYYVCCTGCRDYFNDDPEGAMAEYRLRKEEEKKKPDQG